MLVLLAIVTITIQIVLVLLSLCIDIDQLHFVPSVSIKAYRASNDVPAPLRKLNITKT